MAIEVEERESARDVTAAVFDELEGGEVAAEPQEVEPSEPAEPQASETPDGRSRDDQGRFAKGGGKSSQMRSADRSAEAGKAAGAAPGAISPPVAASAAPAGERAPQWLKPAIRDQWGTLDRTVKDEFLRLQGEASRAREQAVKAAEAGKGAGQFTEGIRPYEATFRTFGLGEPAQAVQRLAQTFHALASGPNHVRADTAADLLLTVCPDLLQQTGVDENGVPQVPLISAILARAQGRSTQPTRGQPQDVRSLVQAELRGLIGERQKASEARQIESATSHMEEFSKGHEFYGDVQDTMSHILSAWAAEGKQEVTEEDLERAYDIACQMTQEVRPYYEKKQAAERAAKARQTATKARAAASGIRTSPTLQTPSEQRPKSAREITAQVVSDLEGERV